MFVRDLSGTHPRDLVVQVDDPDATVADLTEALNPHRPPGPLVIDGRSVSAATPLDRAGVGNGSVLEEPGSALGSHEPDPPAAPVATLTVTAGPDAGRRVGLCSGTHRLGRAGASASGGIGLADPTVSAHQLTLTASDDGMITVVDAGGPNPTRVGSGFADGPTSVPSGVAVRCGATRFVVTPGPPSGAKPVAGPGARWSGTPPRPLHRTGRPAPVDQHDRPLSPPPEPEPPTLATPVGVVGVVASVAVGGAMVLVLGSWVYGLFALLGPVLMVANSIDSRRRRRRSGRSGDRRRRSDLAALDHALAERRTDARRRRWREVVGPGEARATIDRLAAGRAGTGCWERRPGDADGFTLRVGVGDAPWSPPMSGDPDDWPADVAEVAGRYDVLPEVPLRVTLQPGRPVAVVGGEAALGVARSMVVQAAVAHGPADLLLAVVAGEGEADNWDWCCWLPHACSPRLGALVAVGPDRTDALADRLVADAAEPPETPLRLVLIHDRDGLAARRSGARTIMRTATDPRSGLVPLVVVPDRGQVPAACTLVLEVDDDGTLRAPADLCCGPGVVVGTAADVAAEIARELARHEDPEVDDLGRGLPHQVPLASLLGVDRLGPPGIAARWSAAGPDPAPTAVLGSTVDGPLEVDLAADGPHALVAGTTGSGKSELLRTLVLSLAASSSPRHLTFVLIDFKGGGAFDACARLPHTCGLVTDLDEHLASRALRCLEAELRHREQRLRELGADDLSALRSRRPDGEPLPRLVVVIDEFATLATELPDFVDALVGVAQRGRSLGVHLVLATQRPSGAVSERIRANVSLRIALRVQSEADSSDVIDDGGAAQLPRGRPGRALVRLGPGELVPVQTALSTASSLGGGEDGRPAGRVRVGPLSAARFTERPSHPAGPGRAGPSDLDRVAAAMQAAWAQVDGTAPRRPWPDPLPSQVDWPMPDGDHGPDGSPERLIIALADEPDRQRQAPFAWALDDGPLLLVGLPGSGTSSALATIALEAARRWEPSDLHIHVIDLGAGDHGALAGLPHVGAVVHGSDRERQRRLIADLSEDLERRSADPTMTGRRRMLLVDGLGAFRAAWDEVEPSGTWDLFLAVVTRGAEVGMHVAITADGPGSAPHQVIGACVQRLVFRLGDSADHSVFGIPAAAVPRLVPGRAVAADGPTVVQVARPPGGTATAVARLAGAARPLPNDLAPRPVGRLPDRLFFSELAARAELSGDGGLMVPVGRSDNGLLTAHLRLPPGGHALVAGPPRSGRTSALKTIAASADNVEGLRVVAVTRDDSRWPDGTEVVHPTASELEAALHTEAAVLVLVDDADVTADDHAVLAPLVSDRRHDRHVVAAARSDRARSLFGHWIREVRADRAGILLVPDLDVDGDLTAVRLPRRSPVPLVAGRGWLSGGSPEGFLQLALPDPPSTVDRS